MKPTRALVIGSGFGGLALAIRLQSAGFAVTLLEGRERPGGRAYVYEDRGYVFDAGPTVITDPACLEEVFALSARSLADYVTLLPVTPFYQLRWEDGTRFDYVNDQDELDRQIARISPPDVAGYRRFLAYSQELFEEGYVKLGAVPFLSFWDMIKAAPQLAKLEAWNSVYAMVSRFIENEKLRQAFSFHSLLVGGNPFETSSIYALIHALERKGGVWFPKGGTGALVQGMVRVFEDLGGLLRCNAPVDQILLDGARVRGVRLADGEELASGIVASNADVVHTYSNLLRDTPRASEGRRKAAMRHSMSLFVIYFGARKVWGDLAHHSVLFGPRYRELIREIFRGPNLPDDFSLYLHAPTLSDPDLAPPGSTAFYVLSPVPHLGAAPLDWAHLGPIYRDAILKSLDASILPGLLDNLETTRIFTPMDFRDELNAHMGSAFSLEPILTQSAYFRTHNRDDAISGLYFVGAGTHPGAGVPGVIGSAKATAGLILEDFPQSRSAA